MAALIPMCGIRNLRQLSCIAATQLSSFIDFTKQAQDKKLIKPSSFPNRPCKCLYSTAPASSRNDEIVDSSKQTVDSSDDSSKDKSEDKKPNLMKKYAKTIFWSSAVMGTFTLGMLIKRWGRSYYFFLICLLSGSFRQIFGVGSLGLGRWVISAIFQGKDEALFNVAFEMDNICSVRPINRAPLGHTRFYCQGALFPWPNKTRNQFPIQFFASS